LNQWVKTNLRLKVVEMEDENELDKKVDENKAVSFCKTSAWIENDMMGARHVVVQRENLEPFTYCSFNYCYGYTDNASTLHAATVMALSLGAMEPVEQRMRVVLMSSRASARS
jgi:hypothetical protein